MRFRQPGLPGRTHRVEGRAAVRPGCWPGCSAGLLATSLTDLSLNRGTLDVVSAPTTVPPLFTNSRLVMYGVVKTLAPSTVTLTGIGPKGNVSFDVALNPSQVARGKVA